MIAGAPVRKGAGQAVRECPGCGQALVDTGDGIWAHALGVEPCGWKPRKERSDAD